MLVVNSIILAVPSTTYTILAHIIDQKHNRKALYFIAQNPDSAMPHSHVPWLESDGRGVSMLPCGYVPHAAL